MSNVVPLPVNATVLGDVRDTGRALRATWHLEDRVMVLSLWRDDTCVATARLSPEEAARLATTIVDGLAELSAR